MSVELWTEGSPRLRVEDWGGSGPPLLLAHGMAGNAHWWDAAAPTLAASLRTAALDLRGHGDSGWSEEGYAPEGFAEDLEAARRRLGWEKLVLAGHSHGARVCLDYAATRPERVLAVVAVDFLPEYDPLKSERFERARRLPQPVYPGEEEILRRFHLEPPATLLDAGSLRRLGKLCVRRAEAGFTWKFDWRALGSRYGPVWPVLPRIQAPTLLVRGGRSPFISEADLGRMLRLLPRGEGAFVPRAHHHVPLDAPGELARLIASFARRAVPC